MSSGASSQILRVTKTPEIKPFDIVNDEKQKEKHAAHQFFRSLLGMIRPKAAHLLDPLSYESLRQQILRRDGWRCQSCGTMSNLEVHHREFRSHSGADSEENLITLCTACYCRVHRH